MSTTPYADKIIAAVDEAHDELVSISLDIHSHPELNYEEYHASALLADTLERHGFEVERGVGGVETAFRGTLQGAKGDGPTVAFLVEYDALPGIGHGCGHNLIAISNLGASLGAKAALDDVPGRIVVLGTPAEEGGGGKIKLIDAGVFNDIDIALSSHPSSNRTTIPTDIPLDENWSLALVGYRFVYRGKAAHAATVPHEGVNALNAVIQLFNGIDAMRQHLKDDARVHGIITDGGRAANVVPDRAEAHFMLRSADRHYLDVVEEKVHAIARGAAEMTGAELEVLPTNPRYENVRPNAALSAAALANADAAGLSVNESPPGTGKGGASTDFGNVSQRIPSYYTRFAVSEEPVPGHSIAMTEAAKGDLAQSNAIAVAKLLAMTACDVLTNPELLKAAQEEFKAREGF